MELRAVCVCVLERCTIEAPARKIAYPVVDFCLGLTLAYAALTKQVIVGSFGKCGNGGKSEGNDIGGSLKSSSGRSSEEGPVLKLTLYQRHHFCVCRKYVAMPLRYL